MKDPYTACYLAGRLDESDSGTPDLDRLVESVMLGKSIRDVTIDAARQFIAETEGHEEEKAEWIADNRASIDESGGDGDKAWKLYTQGRAEALAHQLEDDVLCLIEDTEEEEEEDDDDGDGDEEDREEEEDENDEEDAEEDKGSGRHGTRVH
jgi:hypothetical protein